jgi:hypothetical protein
MKQELKKELSELKQKVESIEKRIESMPDEKGKWVPRMGELFYLINGEGKVDKVANDGTYARNCIARGNCYPTEHAAIEAREQQDFIREWLNAGDAPNDKHGYILMFEGQEPKFVYTELLYFGPKFSSVSVGLKALDSHGGPDVVRERFAMGWV